MAKYVLLQFDDDGDADAYVEYVRNARTVQGSWGEGTKACDVRGVWKKPTKHCECTSLKNRGFTRGKKFGWWVCSQCGKPTQAWIIGHHWFMALGKNLLPVDNRAPEYRGDGVFARHHEPCKTCGTTLMTELGMSQAKVWCPKCEVYK